MRDPARPRSVSRVSILRRSMAPTVHGRTPPRCGLRLQAASHEYSRPLRQQGLAKPRFRGHANAVARSSCRHQCPAGVLPPTGRASHAANTKCDPDHTQIAHMFVSWNSSWQSHEQSHCPPTQRSRWSPHPPIIAAPLLLGFGPAATVVAFAIGALLLGLAVQAAGPGRTIPLSAHAGFDYVLAARRGDLRAGDRDRHRRVGPRNLFGRRWRRPGGADRINAVQRPRRRLSGRPTSHKTQHISLLPVPQSTPPGGVFCFVA